MKLTVTYELTDEQEEKLEGLVRLTELLPGCASWTAETMFESVMTLGSAHDINDRLNFYENSVRGIIMQMKEGEEDG